MTAAAARGGSTNIKVDQFGYLARATKVAVISQAQQGYNAPESFVPGDSYDVRRADDDQTVLSGEVEAWNAASMHTQSGDKVWHFDFSSLTTPGRYYVWDPKNSARSHDFVIDDNVYRKLLKTAVKAFFYQRCGTAKSAVHAGQNWSDGACHGADRTARSIADQNNGSTAKDLSGGWHDAGDYTKYVSFTEGPVHNLLDAYTQNSDVWDDDYGIPESGNQVPDVLDEVKYELDWLLKMQLPDGSVLTKIGTANNDCASPPSSDAAARYYGPAQASSTRSFAGVTAHAALVFETIPSLLPYANTLRQVAELAFDWANANPSVSNYDNAGFSSTNPEKDGYGQDSSMLAAAAYLFALTGETRYRDHFDGKFRTRHMFGWRYVYPFESLEQNVLLFYASLPDATQAVATAIRDLYSQAMSSGGETLPAFASKLDGYRAYLKDADYIWSSNQAKAEKGVMYANMLEYGIDSERAAQYRAAAAGFLHYLHGVNPNGLVYLTNVARSGAERSANEMFHCWFQNGSRWDSAVAGAGPAPGFLTGGPNAAFVPAAECGCNGALTPPIGQPPQKAYRDWNTSWPENSWELTEPAIYYQASYVKLLASFVPNCP